MNSNIHRNTVRRDRHYAALYILLFPIPLPLLLSVVQLIGALEWSIKPSLTSWTLWSAYISYSTKCDM